MSENNTDQISEFNPWKIISDSKIVLKDKIMSDRSQSKIRWGNLTQII